MLRFCQRIGTATCGLAIAATLATGAGAQNKPQKVGSVVDIDGPRLMTNRLKEGSWYQAYPTMVTNLGEKMKSDDKTTATLEFVIGGQAVITPGTEIEVVGQREIDEVGNKVIVKTGKMWAKIDKQSSQLQIQTAGGTIGIEGTEFFLEVSPDGQNELTLLEGEVSVTSTTGGTERIKGGQGASFGQQGFRRVALAAKVTDALAAGSVREAREMMMDKIGLPLEARSAIDFASRRSAPGGRKLDEKLLYRARKDLTFAGSRHAFSAYGLTGMMGRRRSGSKPRPETVVTHRATGNPPVFSWKGIKKAKRYAVLLSTDSEGLDPLWFAIARSDEIAYPVYGPSLTAEQEYYWKVMPLSGDGTSLTEDAYDFSSDDRYTSPGFVSAPLAVQGVTVSSDQGGLPVVAWTPLNQARSYRLVFASERDQEPLWVGLAEGSSYRYPQSARALAASTYQVRVEAYDEFGVRMGTSPGVSFATEGWTSSGDDQPR